MSTEPEIVPLDDRMIRVVVPAGMLGGGFPAETVTRGVELGARAIVIDGGSPTPVRTTSAPGLPRRVLPLCGVTCRCSSPPHAPLASL